jgi:DnaJ-class molecular chaperone
VTALIAHLAKCRTCKGTGALPARIHIGLDGSGGFTPGVVCKRCNGTGVRIVGGCMCDEVDEEHEHE